MRRRAHLFVVAVSAPLNASKASVRRELRNRLNHPGFQFHEPDIHARKVTPLPAFEASRDPLRSAATALLAAYGGDWPDWLRDELAALETALES
jgi:hypothetical protein